MNHASEDVLASPRPLLLRDITPPYYLVLGYTENEATPPARKASPRPLHLRLLGTASRSCTANIYSSGHEYLCTSDKGMLNAYLVRQKKLPLLYGGLISLRKYPLPGHLPDQVSTAYWQTTSSKHYPA